MQRLAGRNVQAGQSRRLFYDVAGTRKAFACTLPFSAWPGYRRGKFRRGGKRPSGSGGQAPALRLFHEKRMGAGLLPEQRRV